MVPACGEKLHLRKEDVTIRKERALRREEVSRLVSVERWNVIYVDRNTGASHRRDHDGVEFTVEVWDGLVVEQGWLWCRQVCARSGENLKAPDTGL